jgi:hypothetical protein
MLTAHNYSRVAVSAYRSMANSDQIPKPLVCWELVVTSKDSRSCDPITSSRGNTARARPNPLSLGWFTYPAVPRDYLAGTLQVNPTIQRLSGTQVHLYRASTACPFSPKITVTLAGTTNGQPNFNISRGYSSRPTRL